MVVNERGQQQETAMRDSGDNDDGGLLQGLLWMTMAVDDNGGG